MRELNGKLSARHVDPTVFLKQVELVVVYYLESILLIYPFIFSLEETLRDERVLL